MNRLSRHVVVVAVAAAVALGSTAAPALAGPGGKDKAAAASSAKAGNAKSDRKLATSQRRLVKTATRKDRYLDRLSTHQRVIRLEDGLEAAVTNNIAADRTKLGELKEAAKVAATRPELRVVAAALGEIRPAVYNQVTSQAQKAGSLAESTLSPEVLELLNQLISSLGTYDAETLRDQLRETRRLLSELEALLEEAEEGADEAEDEDTEDEVDEEDDADDIAV